MSEKTSRRRFSRENLPLDAYFVIESGESTMSINGDNRVNELRGERSSRPVFNGDKTDMELPPLPSAGSPVTASPRKNLKKTQKGKRKSSSKHSQATTAKLLVDGSTVEDIIKQSARYSLESMREVFSALDGCKP